MQGLRPNERSANEFLDQARTALHASLPVRRAAVSALQKYQTLDEAAREARGKKFSGKPESELSTKIERASF